MLVGAGALVAGTLALGAATVGAQQAKAPQQQVVPPKTVYWMSAATQTGFGFSPGAAPAHRHAHHLARVGRGGPVRSLDLDLGSRHSTPAAPPSTLVATHAIPPGMAMGAGLPLRSPPPIQRGRPEPAEPPEFERPRGKLLLFWGCGEAARPGQPVVIDFARVAEGQIPPGLFAGERVRIARPPSRSSWPTFGEWPNDDRAAGAKAIPASASLVGPHRVSGQYIPTMDFALQQDWMGGLALSQAKAASGALALSWNAVPGATGHFLQMFGGRDEGGDPTVVFWSSSETQTFISALSDYVAPAEAARLVRARQMLPPTQTSCAVPKEAMAAVEGGVLSLVAHGPEVNLIHPPRPADPRTPWEQEWAMKARFVTRAGAIAGMDMPAMAGAGAGDRTASGRPRCPRDATEQAGRDVGGAVLGGGFGRAVGGALAGGFGRKKKPDEDCEE
jgi:hypothetical protein